MNNSISLTPAEEKLAVIIWRNAPLSSPELVLITEQETGWKKSTTYTILKKLCDKGVFRNENAQVTILLTRDELIAHQSRVFVEEAFGGSLPRFIASFIGNDRISPEQAEEIRKLIGNPERGDVSE